MKANVLVMLALVCLAAAPAFAANDVNPEQVAQIQHDTTVLKILDIPVDEEVAIYTDIVQSGAKISASDFLSLQAATLLYTFYGEPVLTVKGVQLYQAFLDFLPYPPTREESGRRRVIYDTVTLSFKTDHNGAKALAEVLKLDKKQAKEFLHETRHSLEHLF